MNTVPSRLPVFYVSLLLSETLREGAERRKDVLDFAGQLRACSDINFQK